MAKYRVTKELCETLRSLRIDNCIKSIDLAHKINKSPAYITKLEKGAISTIKPDVLIGIIDAINDLSSVNIKIEDIICSLSAEFTNQEIQEQTWFLNYDTVIRQIPVPVDLIEDINKKMHDLSYSRDSLLLEINSNKVLTDEYKQRHNFDKNIWMPDDESNDGKQNIIIEITYARLANILDGYEKTSPYYILNAIVFYVMKYEKYGTQIISENDYMNIDDMARKYLKEYKVYRLLDRGKLFKITENPNISLDSLSVEDLQNKRILNEIFEIFRYMSDTNVKKANNCLEQFNTNLEWDPAFMFALISLPYSSLINSNFEDRKRILKEIHEIILNCRKNTSRTSIDEYI